MNILLIFLLEWTEPTDKVNAIDVSNCEKIILENDLLWVFVFFGFVCLEFIVLLEIFSFIWRRHQSQRRAANFDLCLALMAIEQ